MSGQRHSLRLIVSSAVIAAGATLCVPAVEAQTLRPAIRDDEAPLPRLKPRTPAPVRPAAAPAAAEPVGPAVLSRRTIADDKLQPEVMPADGEPEVVQVPSGVRPSIRDGDGDVQAEPEAVVDGIADGPEDYINPDGRDPVQWDAREPEDAAAFERPAAGYDRQAFGVELTPNDDRRPFYFYRFEPWQPRGITMGSFTVFPQADIGAAWVSNLFRSRPARADQAIELRPTIRAFSNWRAHALELRATGALSFFDNHPREDDRAYALEARGRLDVTRRTQIAGSVLRDVAQEGRGALEPRLRGGSRADIETNEAKLQIDHRFNRLSLQLRGVALRRTYDDVVVADGSSRNNRDRNLMATEETARLAWAFKPTFIGFTEAGINQRRFDAASAFDGIKRDSDGERYRVGVGFGTTGQLLRGEASIGYGRQTPLDQRLTAIDGVVIDANLAWRMSAMTALLLRGSTDVVETTSLKSAGGFTRRAQAEVRHAFMRPLIGTASAGFATTSYQGIVINENLTELALGLEYYLGPEAMLYGRYQHATLSSNAPGGDWASDEVRIGMRIRR